MFAQARTFRCPNCKEMVNDSMADCPFCKVPLDPAIVALIAERQEKANRAYSDANFLRTAAGAMFVFMAVGLIPLLGFIYYGFIFTFVVVLILLIRWQVKFGGLLTDDADYLKAKRLRNIALILWLVAIPLGFLLGPFLSLILSRLF
jgi:hypothetical protein